MGNTSGSGGGDMLGLVRLYVVLSVVSIDGVRLHMLCVLDFLMVMVLALISMMVVLLLPLLCESGVGPHVSGCGRAENIRTLFLLLQLLLLALLPVFFFLVRALVLSLFSILGLLCLC